MPSSFAKNRWIHRCLSCIAACGIAASYVLLNQKVCQMPLMSSHDDVAAQLPLKHSGDSNSISEAVKKFAQSYYEWSQIYHYVIFGFCIVILILSFINIVPKHQDLKVITISLVILSLGSIALFAFYTSWVTFNKPCKTNPNGEYKLVIRTSKDKRPVNAYEDEDEVILKVTAIDAGVGFILLCSCFLYWFDTRQVMIEWRN